MSQQSSPTPQRVGFRIATTRAFVEDAVVARLGHLETVYITDAMAKFGALDGTVRPIVEGQRMVGRALTVRPAAGDNMAAYMAMEHIQQGDVLVIEGRGQTSVAQWGDLASAVAQKAGAAGVVIDGATRDRSGMISVGLPVFASPHFVPNGSSRTGPGEINVPVALAGVAILPGDVIVGDDHGVVAVPAQHAEQIADLAEAVERADHQKMAAADAGDPSVTAWLSAARDAAGY